MIWEKYEKSDGLFWAAVPGGRLFRYFYDGKSIVWFVPVDKQAREADDLRAEIERLTSRDRP